MKAIHNDFVCVTRLDDGAMAFIRASTIMELWAYKSGGARLILGHRDDGEKSLIVKESVMEVLTEIVGDVTE